jgi:DNA invertase Pin-like site-specific DNA recombinase
MKADAMPRAIDDAALRRLLAEGLSQREIARRLGVPRTTLQDYLKRQQVVPVHRGTPTLLTRGPQTPADLRAITSDLLEVAAWWRARKLRRVDPGGPRETRRQTWHVAEEWIERVKEMAEAEGVSQAEIVDRAFRQFFGML